MRYFLFSFIMLLCLPGADAQEKNSVAANENNLRLWYTKPAANWNEALPVGNGRLGAMIFGNPQNEMIQLNEESIWAGSKINNNNPAAFSNLAAFRSAIFENRFDDAKKIAANDFLGTPPRIRSYQPLGDLLLRYQWTQQPTGYTRDLDLNTATSSTQFDIGTHRYRQEVWASAPDNFIAVKINSPTGGLISVELQLKRERDAIVRYEPGGRIFMSGQIIDADDPLTGPGGAHMKFASEMKVTTSGGTLLATDSSLLIRNAKDITIILTAATDYSIRLLDFDRTIQPEAICRNLISKATQKSYQALYQRHLKEYQPAFQRVQLNLGTENAALPVNERLDNLKKGKQDNSLEALYFQYGRYLLLASSRKPGVLPANLQGIWNKEFNAPWNADFHTNINLQMNYWPAENCNLPETSEVLAGFMKQLMKPGAATAREMYGTNGWTLHHLTDPFGRTGVADGPWGITPMNGPWMTFPVYEHFLFTRDTAFLRQTAYPLLKGSVEFLLGFLVKSPDGYWVTSPSHSPENDYLDPVTGKHQTLTYAATIDIEIANALFDYFTEAAAILKTDPLLSKKVREVQKGLPPIQINSKGCLQEWIKDFEEVEPGHRHMSHLLGLYPLAQFTPQQPQLFNAARASLERRLSHGGGHTGWSRAWIISFYARLLNGDKAHENLLELLKKSTFINLFDVHPPFQIDGNFGGTAGIAEMLLQSHNGQVSLLPALPAAWPDGSVKGLVARGGFEIAMDWNRQMLKSVSIRSAKGGQTELVYQGKKIPVKLKAGSSKTIRF